jgi:hypothetical protein
MQNQSQTMAGQSPMHSIHVKKEVVSDGTAEENRSVDAKYGGDDIYGPKVV